MSFLYVHPEAFLVCLGIGLVLFEAFFTSNDNKKPVGLAAVIGLVFALILTFTKGRFVEDQSVGTLPPELLTFFRAFSIVATILMVVMAIDYRKVLSRFTDFPDSENGTGEFYSLPVFACAGMLWMISAKDLISAFVALELVTITFYVLVAYMRRNVGSLEAGVKYLILGALSAGFMVYGIAWIFGACGTTEFTELPAAITAAFEGGRSSMLLFGIALVLIGLGFKVGAVPTQVWIPDVYQGAPTPTTAFLSVASKAAGFGLLLIFLHPLLSVEETRTPILLTLSILAGATLVFGNLAALAQSNLKRLLAYSSIAHAGFMLLVLSSWNPSETTDASFTAPQVVAFYLATYLVMTIGIFFALAAVSSQEGSDEIDAFNGLGKRNPVLAMAVAILMTALAGLPLTAGFYGKLYVFEAAVAAKQWWLVGISILAVASGFYYYLKVIRAMYWNLPSKNSALEVPVFSSVVIASMVLITIVIGFWPEPILWMLNAV